MRPPGDRADIAARRHFALVTQGRGTKPRSSLVARRFQRKRGLLRKREGGARPETAMLTFCPPPAAERSLNDQLATTAVTSISSSIPGMASALMTKNVLAGIGPPP